MRPGLLLILALGVGAACAPTRAIRPLDKGQTQLQLSAGGPFVDYFGGQKPLPLTGVSVAHGVSDKTAITGALYPTQLALFRVFGMDVGATHLLLEQDGARPRLMLDGRVYVFGGDYAPDDPAQGGVRVFPDLQLIAAWDVGNHAIYTGYDNFFQPLPTFHYHGSFLLGGEVRPTPGFGVQLETKWISPWANTLVQTPVWLAPGNQGALSIQLGFNVAFGGQP